MSRDFSWRQSAAQYLDLYRRLAAEPGSQEDCHDTLERALA
jgi:glycogen synthase